MRIRAFLPALNEADILYWSVAHLLAQGIEVYVIDGWSTDGSWEMLDGLGVCGKERFPADAPANEQVCSSILARVEILAAESGADWCYLNDADEIRRSNRPGETLAQGIERVAMEGYSVIDHQVYAFWPTDDGYRGDPEQYLRYFGDDMICHLPQQKCWKNAGRVDLVTHGGHQVEFVGKRVAPEQFVMKHYPYRTNAQATERLRTRLARRCHEEHREGWGVHYDPIAKQTNFLRDPATLTFWRDTEHPAP